MPVDLRALHERCRHDDPAVWSQQFSEALKHYAKRGDLMCYGLLVHGDQAEELRNLAWSRHGALMAADCETSKVTAHILPPESGKTALMRWELEQWLGMETERAYTDPKARVPSAHYIMNTASQAEKQIMEIERTIEGNARYKELFPHVKPDKRSGWTKEHFFLDRPRSRPDPTLQGTGMMGPIQGGRVGFQGIDDPTDQQDARSPGILKAQSEWIMGTAADRVLRSGIRRFRFTRWSERDTFATVSAIKRMLVRVMPALGYWGEGTPLWPEVWDRQRLEEKRQELIDSGQAYLWSLTWLCSPKVAEGDMFLRKWLIYGMPKVEEGPSVS